jgi:1,4-dihydroxy-2-naphthoyl-CoA hydrolase
VSGPPLALSVTFDGLYGLEFEECTPEQVRARVPVAEELLVGGRVHGGVYVAMAESMASLGTASGIDMSAEIAAGRFNTTELTGAPAAGTLHAVARRIHRDPGESLWDVTIEDDAGTLCAMARVGIAVRPLPS